MKVFSERKRVCCVDNSLIYANIPQISLSVHCKNENGELNIVLSYVDYHNKTGTWLDVATAI